MNECTEMNMHIGKIAKTIVHTTVWLKPPPTRLLVKLDRAQPKGHITKPSKHVVQIRLTHLKVVHVRQLVWVGISNSPWELGRMFRARLD